MEGQEIVEQRAKGKGKGKGVPCKFYGTKAGRWREFLFGLR